MDLTLAELVLFMLLGSAATALIFAIGSHVLHDRNEYRSLSRRVVCRLCLHAFETRENGKIIDCPSCGVLNERGRSRKLG